MNQDGPNLEEIFYAARDLPGSEARAAYLDEVCEPDSQLRDRVERLLAADPLVDRFLEAPAAPPTHPFYASPAKAPGSVIGPYRLLEPIGEGGMGAVYMAEQDEPIRRRVALKLIKPGMDTKQVIARFDAERQALAMMDHPNIARALDAGATESGRSFFVMVYGVPVTAYRDRARTSINDRLDLFVQICEAVQHAHQKGVIHRDLKPSNVLVTLQDGAPVVKVIDFGVAKATGPSLTDKTLHTVFAQLVGTPLYMSPEQAEPSGPDVDTRSDVYSLGVLLYELLTGTTPFDREKMSTATIDEMRRIIREEEPPRPSTRLESLGGVLTDVSSNRGADPRRLMHTVRGELDWIVMKALEKDRRRRYETASGFAADVRRYLADEPVEACPPSAVYRLGKLARRHKAILTTSGLMALALVVGTAVSIWQASLAMRSSKELLRRSEETRQVVRYLVDNVLGGGGGPARADGRAPSIVDMLESADATLSRTFAGQPLVEAPVRMAMGRAYDHLAAYDKSAVEYERAAEIYLRHLGPEHPDTLSARSACIAALAGRGRKDEAIALGRSILESRRRLFGPDHPDTIFSLAHLGYLMGRWDEHRDEAVRMGIEAASRAERALGPGHNLTRETLDVLGVNFMRRGDMAQAEQLLRRAVAGYAATSGSFDWNTIWG